MTDKINSEGLGTSNIPAFLPSRFCPNCGADSIRRAASAHPAILNVECVAEGCGWTSAPAR
jgi:predicted RNA-binding Zn-ribbon protein involved in translation (DUF1610 family)